MKKFFVVLGMLAGLCAPLHAATLEVFACEPEWGALTRELGGAEVSVYVATTALQDPHRIEARPSLLAKARRAELLVCTGGDLEIGWLPMVLQQAGNAAIQPGRPGYFEAVNYVQRLEIPATLDRAAGDIHAGGNPHIHTDPRNISRVASALAQRLAEIDPGHAAYYQARHLDFATRWEVAIQRWEKQAAPLREVPIVVHHKTFAYLENWLGLKEVAQLEAKPGIEPSGAHLTKLLAELQRQPAKMVIRTAYDSARASKWLVERTQIREVVLPYTVGGSDKAKDLFGLFDDTVQRLVDAAQ